MDLGERGMMPVMARGSVMMLLLPKGHLSGILRRVCLSPGTLLNKWGFKPDTYSGRLPVMNGNRTRTGLGWQGRGDVNVPLRRFHEEIEGEDLAGSLAAAVAEKQHVIGTVFDKVPVAVVSKRRRVHCCALIVKSLIFLNVKSFFFLNESADAR